MTAPADKPVIGVIGGIGSGKSRVAAELVLHGGYLIAGDPLGHEGLRQPEIRQQVLQRWGTDILKETGEIDRRKLGRIVFANPEELRYLEGLLFPYIGRRIREEIVRARQNPQVRFIVLDAAVLLEAGWNNAVNYLVFVETRPEVRLERLLRNRGWTEMELRQRESNQMSLEEKKAHADAVIDNSGPEDALALQIEQVLQKWNLLPGPTLVQ